MNWEEKKASLASYLKGLSVSFKMSGEESPDILRKKQLLRLGIGCCVALLGAAYGIGIFDSTTIQPQDSSKKKPEKPQEQRVADLSTPLSSVKDGDLWVARVEKLVKNSQEELEKVKSENVFLDKKINTLMGALGSNPEARAKAMQELQALGVSGKNNKTMGSGASSAHGRPQEGSQAQSQNPGASPSQISLLAASPATGPQHFPSVNGGIVQLRSVGGDQTSANTTSPNRNTGVGAKGGGDTRVGDARVTKKRKLLHLSNANVSDNSNKSPDTYLPAGTYFKVVTAMGVVVSTGTNSSSDPQPILLRIVDNGNLPGGLKGKVKDAVLIGTCYGSASAERAICRLKTLSWRDKSNRNIEKPIEGWIASEDGVQGIRAKIIDRSSEIAREAFGAGMLSAASNFFKMEATNSVFPMTPFGQTNALSKTDSLKAAAGGGAANALDKLAEFSIKRAESMSPVAYVASGRVLDAVLMRGVDLSPLVQEGGDLRLVNSTSEPQNQPQHQAGENQ